MKTKFPDKVQAVIAAIEGQDFSVDLYDENGVVCGAEIESWTDGGVDMIHFIDLRGKDINDPEDWKEEIAAIASGFDIDEEIEVHRQNKEYCSAFTCRASVEDFEGWQERLRLLAQAVIYPEVKAAGNETTIIAVLNEEKMPEFCDDCPLFDKTASDYGRCPVTSYSYCSDESCERPPDCPLREVPDDVLQP